MEESYSANTAKGVVEEIRKVAETIHPEIQKFQNDEQAWFEKRFESNEIVCALPGFDRYPWQAVIPFDLEESRIESEFSQLCERFRLMGLGLKSPMYPPFIFECYWNLFSEKADLNDILKKLPSLGWEEKHLRRIRQSFLYADDINCRRQSGAARLICNPNFLEERNALRASWENLVNNGSKPVFPLLRTVTATATVEADDDLSDSILRVFWENFDRFCQTWVIDGLTTWNLPMAKGIRSFDHSLQTIVQSENAIDEGTPGYFPLNSKDVAIGDHDRRRHREKAKAEGIDDFGKWKKHAHLLEIYHWQEVIRCRYPEKGTAVNLKSKFDDILSIMWEHNAGDLRKLRQYLREFQQGTRTSLQDVR